MNQLHHPSFDRSPYNIYVLPEYCKQLEMAGLEPNVVFWWVETGITPDKSDMELVSYFYDADDYYYNAHRIIDATNGVKNRVSAFTFKDIEQLMPMGFFLSKDDAGQYVLSLPKMYQVEMVASVRMPDVFAKMLLQCIRKRIIDLKLANITMRKALGVLPE